MPGPLVIPGIAAGASILGQVINAKAQGNMNKKTRKWSEKMYALQRADNLADWQRQNDYNSPAAQMQRLKDAGLNPALVYENGATTASVPIRSADAPSWNPKAATFDPGAAVGAGLGAYYDTALKQAQTDNLRKQVEVSEQQKTLIAAQTLATLAGTEKTKQDTASGKFDLDLKSDLRQNSLDVANALLQKTRADIESTKASTQYTIDENQRKALLNATTVTKMLEETKNILVQRGVLRHQIHEIDQRISNMQKEGEFRELDLEARRMGIQPNDPAYMRIMQKLFSKVFKDVPEGKYFDIMTQWLKLHSSNPYINF